MVKAQNDGEYSEKDTVHFDQFSFKNTSFKETDEGRSRLSKYNGDETYENHFVLRPHMGELPRKELIDDSVTGEIFNEDQRTVTNISRDTSRYLNPNNETDRTMKTIDMDDR